MTSEFLYVYILQSETSGRFYIGQTDDLERRVVVDRVAFMQRPYIGIGAKSFSRNAILHQGSFHKPKSMPPWR
ncbi:MAG: GIY-YIG nuclease family protein [Planctomycetota bacterium]|jgi:hypothetical protein